jgi:hypothetical protein
LLISIGSSHGKNRRNENCNLASIGKHLKSIAEQQKRQTEHLRNISAVGYLLLVAVVVLVAFIAAKAGILF